MNTMQISYKKLVAPLILVIVIITSLFSRNYLFFHTTIEFFSILTAFSLYVVGTRTFRFSQNKILLFLGISFFFVAIFDSAHLLTYKGMGVFPGLGANTATQFWVAGRFLEILALCIIPVLLYLSASIGKTLAGFSLLSISLFLLIVTGRLPACFQDGVGLTPFKTCMELIITTMGVFALLMFQKATLPMKRKVRYYIQLSLWAFIASELCFTLYTDITDRLNALGHILKLISYWFIWSLIVQEGLENPYEYLFGNLYQKVIKDELTGLFNKLGFLEIANNQFARAKRFPTSFILLFLDLDNFKSINDTYGHNEGDLALREFATMLKETFRETDVIARIGGDEFLVLLECEPQMENQILSRFQFVIDRWERKTPKREGINVTIGKAFRPALANEDIEHLIHTADSNMIRNKMLKKLSR